MRRILTVALCLSAVISLAAKGRTVKLSVSGPRLPQAIDVTTPDALSANPWAMNFTEPQVVHAPSHDASRYEVAFYEELPSREVKKMYVVTYAYDPASRQGFVYFPGPADPSYRLNISTISNEDQNGTWHHASEPWSRAIVAALRARDTLR